MAEQVIYIHKLDRAPTLEDRMNKVGLEGFVEKLKECGWVDRSDKATVLKPFGLSCEGHMEPGNNYVKWCAVLRE